MMARCSLRFAPLGLFLFALLLALLGSANPALAQRDLPEFDPKLSPNSKSNPGNGQGLLSRLRNSNPKPTKDPADPDPETRDRRWTGGMKVPLQSFNMPWSNRNNDPKASLNEPIDLPKAMQPSRPRNDPATRNNFQSRASLQEAPANSEARANSEAIGSGVAKRSSPKPTTEESIQLPASTPPAPPEPTIDPVARKELRVYEAAPTEAIDPKNTSRRKPQTPTNNSKPIPITSSDPASQPPTQTPSPNAISDLPDLPQIDIAPVPRTTSPKVPAILTAGPNKTNQASTPLDVRVPQLRLRVDGPQAIAVGQKATYTIHATNEGASDLQGLIVRASTPKGVLIDGIKTMVGAYELDETPEDSGVLWELDSLAANDSKSLELQIEVLEADQFALNLEWTLAPKPTQMNVQVHQPKLELELSGPAEVQLGAPETYRMRIKNPGSAVLPDLTLSLQTETTSQYDSQIGPIAPGSEKIIDVELTFEHPGLFPIVAAAKDPSGKLQQRQRIDVQVQKIEVKATWFGPEEFIQGSKADYELVIENSGGIPAANLACSVAIPDGIGLIELPEGVTRQANELRWSIPKLDPKSQFTLPIRCDMNRSGNHTLAFQARSDQNINLHSDISTLVEAIADLELVVNEPQAPAPVGARVVYELQISNRGSKAAEDIRVVAQFSEGIEPLALEGHAGRIVPGQALFENLPSIGPNQTVTLRVICQASKNGVHRFRAAVQSPSSQEDLLEEGSTRFVGSNSKTSKP
jgi:uncharacterized repeat protein (TIGR01451 family)